MTTSNKINNVVTLRSILFGIVFVFNSLVLYVPRVYSAVYNQSFTYIYALLLVVIMFVTSEFKMDLSSLLVSVLIVIVAFVDIQINNLPIGEFFPLVWFIGMLVCLKQFRLDDLCNPMFSTINSLFWLYLVAYSVVFHSEFQGMIYNYESYEGVLNPNTVGIGIAQFYLLWDITRKKKESFIDFKQCLLLFITAITIAYCNARSALLFLLISVFAELVIMKVAIKCRRLIILASCSVVICGFAFPPLFVGLRNVLGPDVSFMGKKLFTGRERIWGTLFDYMNQNKQSYIWGAGKIEGLYWHDVYNLHNSYLAVFSEYGIVVSFLFWLFVLMIVIQMINNYLKSIMNDYSTKARTVLKSLGLVLFTLLIAYTETNYTYILSIIYIVFALGVTYEGVDINDT